MVVIGGPHPRFWRRGRFRSQPVEAEHAFKSRSKVGLENGVSTGDGDVRFRQQRSVRIEQTGFREREEPLNIIVDRLKLVVIPSEDFVNIAAFGIGFIAAIESKPRGGHFSPSYAGLAVRREL